MDSNRFLNFMEVNFMENKKYVYTVDEIKDILGIGINQTYELVKTGVFPVKKIGRKNVIPVAPFHEWLNEQ